MKRLAVVIGLLLAGGAQVLLAQELPLELPERVPAPVMSYRGADWLERPERVSEEMPEEMLAALGLEEGDIVADIGAGSGYYTRRMARIVGPTGRVYAVDIQPEMLDILREGVEEEGLTNVVPVLGEADDPRLPEASIDWMLMVDVYHELADPETMLERMRDALSPGGRIALVEYRVEDGTGDHILAAHRMSVRQVMSEWEPAGFQLVELHEFLPSQHLFVFAETPPDGDAEGAIEHRDLSEATASGVVGATVRGEGATSVEMTARRLAPGRLLVTFPVGTYFPAPDGRTDMVALRDGVALLTDEESRTWSVPARRASPGEPVPVAADALEIESADEHRRERNVLWVYQGLDFPPALAPLLEQLSLWIASADAGYDDLAALLDGAPIPAHNGVALALAYVDSAGIDVRTTRVWSERERFVPALTDPSLRALFDGWDMP